MGRLCITFYALVIATNAFCQAPLRPKLVVGIVVDQMRWDYLYRYHERYSTTGGFKRMLSQGLSCENTMIPFTPTVTATGHSSIYSGSVPAISGITGNTWWDNELNRSVYCVEDKTVTTIGSTSQAGQMSPRNMLVNTICDELRLATNFRSKVIGISPKDRGVILATGHSANAAYWYDSGTGDWITSSYYTTELPMWVKDFNAQKLVDKYYQGGWSTLYPVNTYLQSTGDEKEYEGKPFGKKFPYDLKSYAGKNYGIIKTTPFSNTLTSELAKTAIINEQLGIDEFTDFLAISYSAPDLIGHSFGPNSIESEDGFLRLDKELGDLMDFLDSKLGKEQYLLFLTADHGVAHIPDFLKETNLPAGRVSLSSMVRVMNEKLNELYGKNTLITGVYNQQIYLNHSMIRLAGLNTDSIKKWIIDYLSEQPSIARAFLTDKLMGTALPKELKEKFANGYYPKRIGDIQIILSAQWMDGSFPTGTTHGSWNPYDSHIPLLWYGWNIKPGKLYREVYMTDIAPTLAALLHIQMPNGSVGKVIEEIFK